MIIRNGHNVSYFQQKNSLNQGQPKPIQSSLMILFFLIAVPFCPSWQTTVLVWSTRVYGWRKWRKMEEIMLQSTKRMNLSRSTNSSLHTWFASFIILELLTPNYNFRDESLCSLKNFYLKREKKQPQIQIFYDVEMWQSWKKL